MRKKRKIQAPYGIVGNGKASRHLQRYFKLLKTPYILWSRTSGAKPEIALKTCEKIFILIKDSEIEQFILKNPRLKGKQLFHFSGALVSAHAIALHPFVSFTQRAMNLAAYKAIPFALSPNCPPLGKLVPEFSNPSFRVSDSAKPLYHALCVLGANMPVILWQKTLAELTKRFKVPQKAVIAYFRTALDNFAADPDNSLSGPLQRKDKKTINANLKALKNDPFAKVYKAFVAIND